MNNNWNTFQVFDGTCVLGRTIFNAGATRRHSADAFFQFINNLRQSLAQGAPCGIPAARAQDVIELLNAFFPAVQFTNNNPPSLGRPQFVDVRCIPQNPGPGGNVVAVVGHPINVTFGNGQLAITDGPSALGYIFSIAEAPAAGPPFVNTWEDYVLPLLAIYSRCLYLAYIGTMIPNPHNPNNPNLQWWESNQNVPWMAGAMYFTDDANQLRVLLSSTYVPGRENYGPAQALTRAKQQMMNQWRAANVLNPALQFYNPARVLPPPAHPLPPVLREAVGEGIFKILQGFELNLPGSALAPLPNHIPALPANSPWEPVPRVLTTATFEQVRVAFRNAWLQANAGQDIGAVPQAEIWGRRPFGDQIRNALRAVVDVRWAPAGYNRNNNAIDNAFRPVFDLYFVPRMFNATVNTAAPQNPLAIPTPDYNHAQGELTNLMPEVQVQKDYVWNTLYVNLRNDILDMLDRYHYWVTNNDPALAYGGQNVQRYGRCCETYPIAGLLPGCTPSRQLPVADDNHQPPGPAVSVVRGFAFQARAFSDDANRGAPHLGGTNLNPTFAANTLVGWNTALGTRDGVFRRPCRNCKALLPFFDVPLDNQLTHAYYDHLNQLDPNAAANVPDDPLP
ncbi:hypothetical protein B0T19DRAFT_474657 [Cercophora scortea]|uniref:Uncharacterized protein n=1 Tax=Cercophora scortea TaxID=314031 RepID=A0AAE0IZH4_9PEZI|nr:hypothetical protein B0T19DRAFT_474657 [Cercophora scortea]